MKRIDSLFVVTLIVALASLVPSAASSADRGAGPVITVDGQDYASWSEYVNSGYFKAYEMRCGTAPLALRPDFGGVDLRGVAGDCTETSTNPAGEYDPGPTYEIPVVFHIIQNTAGQGQISDALINSQIDVLNEDFMATAGTPGANGNVGGIRFKLATMDPTGTASTGILHYTNDAWYDDSDTGYTANAWDTNRFLNIYTNTAGGNLGYVPAFPQSGIVGNNADRVVLLWSAVGRNAPIGAPFDQGRTATHEVGHWIALEHTFNQDGACGSATAPGCYTDGDLICDTNPENLSHSGCNPAFMSCGSVDPVDNYMDYSNDTCMEKFTVEQVRRMRCTLQFYRPAVYSVVGGGGGFFSDGFESNNFSAWSGATP